MEFNEYQNLALKSEQKQGDEGLIISLLGLAGEAGELLSVYKKYLRDGESHQLYHRDVKEELGDLLWYLASTAKNFNLSLEDIAKYNLKKVEARWLTGDSLLYHSDGKSCYDELSPEHEQLPRKFFVTIYDTVENNVHVARSFIDDQQVGDDLTDNSYLDDGYRFHDVFHLSYVAILGWSPVFRKNTNNKRRSNPAINEVEDGGRAAVIEEGISALVFAYAKEHNWLENITSIDDSLLKTVMGMASHLEVKNKVAAEWEITILKGFEVWRNVMKNKGGKVLIDMQEKNISYISV
ncbi:MAG: nucleoside triphosphate pyrophosphohydrolase family protein [Bacteroidota bacterium]